MEERHFEPEILLSHCLRYGVYTAAFIIAIGLILLAFNFSAFPTGETFTTIPAVLAGVAQFNPLAVISLGLLVLIFTPILRVAMSILIFLWEKDYLYVFITLFVLVILILSLAFGKAL